MGKYGTGEQCLLYTSQPPVSIEIGNYAQSMYWNGLEVDPDVLEYVKEQLPWMSLERSSRYMRTQKPNTEWDQSRKGWI